MEQAGVGAAQAQEAKAQTGQRPSVGRIVVYQERGGVRLPAIIQNLDGGDLRLCAFGPTGLLYLNDVQQGDGPGQWQWPERT